MQEPSRESADRPQNEELFFGTEMSTWAKIANSVVLTVLVVASVSFVWVMSSLPRIEGIVPIKGLELPASVARDHRGIPHIVARSVRDAYFATGWVHAQDRLWQMEMQRRVGAGRLAEIVGAQGLGNDKFMRTLGLYRLAEAGFQSLDKPTRDALTAYADGVNAWLDAHSHRLPPEFLVLDVHPEPWKPADSLVWGRLMALQLANNWRDEVLKAKLAGTLDRRRINELWPSTPSDAPVTLGAREADALLAAIPAAAEPHLASNIWALSGSRTASGKPLLANDPHLGFQAPILWYLMGIEAPGLHLAGATVPGVPFHLIGHNGRIAWGTTTTHADTVDLFVEKLAGADSYQTPRGAKPFVVREEVIKVKGETAVTLAVRETAHGPVVSDLIAKDLAGPGQVVTLRATALERDDLTAQAFHKVNRAIDWRGFTAALKDFHSPVQNFAFADTGGTIGFATAGRVPLRKDGDGALPARGWTGEGEWTGWIPPERMPQTTNPKSGQLVNANNKVTPERYPFRIASEWPEGYRAQRIAELLGKRTGLEPDDMAAMQLDDVSLAAQELKELLGTPESKNARAVEAGRLIAAWDGKASRGRAEPLIFAAWTRELWRGLLADELAGDFGHFQHLRPYVLIDLLTRHRHWCDNVATAEPESCEQQIAGALERAMATLTTRHGATIAEWKWGDEHHARFSHPILGHIPGLSWLTEMDIATDGDDFTVNRGSFGASDFQHTHGAGMRVVFDLANLANSRFIIATGQSGNPLSRHYDDLVQAWRDNRGQVIGRNHDMEAVLSLEPGY